MSRAIELNYGVEAMQFRLVYDGPLPSGGNSNPKKTKHAIRCQVHSQLKELFRTHPALTGGSDDIGPILGIFPHVATYGDFHFLPLIIVDCYMTCHIDILILRRACAGSIVMPGGDIDNRLKTLFDALRMPRQESEIPPSAKPTEDEKDTFFCLLEDDSLITGFSVKTDRLLSPLKNGEGKDDIRVIMDVSVHVSKIVYDNIRFIGD